MLTLLNTSVDPKPNWLSELPGGTLQKYEFPGLSHIPIKSDSVMDRPRNL